MNKLKSVFLILVVCALFVFAPFAGHADLFIRGTDNNGYRLVYDSDFNITWYDLTGTVGNWDAANTWANDLTVTYNGTVYDDWRLPISDTCVGADCTGSELGHLWYSELGNTFGNPSQPQGYFLNLLFYDEPGAAWSGTEHTNTQYAYQFGFNGGGQLVLHKSGSYGGIAVRAGDVPVTPEPVSSTLFLVGAATLGLRRLRKRFIK